MSIFMRESAKTKLFYERFMRVYREKNSIKIKLHYICKKCQNTKQKTYWPGKRFFKVCETILEKI